MAFSETSFWSKIRRYAKQAGEKTIHTVLLLFYAYKRSDTPTWAKTVIIGALGYFLSPIDAIPDITPLVGYTDDMTVLAGALATVAAYINDEVREKTKIQMAKWFGNKETDSQV
ncbi:MAG: hypothetical protein RLZZ292_705 [Bacteroidota bacterium]|jgi:uncharacterized membrane protein YkvA (DUF1232 family)